MVEKLNNRLKVLTEMRKAAVAETNCFFFYGSLMKRYPNFNRFLKRKTLSIRPAYCQGFLYHLPIGFPGLIPFENCQDLVVGELMTFKHPEKIMKIIDRLEGFYPDNLQKSVYIRVKLPVIVEKTKSPDNFKEQDAWVYTYPWEHLSPEHQKEFFISCGNWKLFCEQPRIKKTQRISKLFRKMKHSPDPQHVHIEPGFCMDEEMHEFWSSSIACNQLCKNRKLCRANRRKQINNLHQL
ncbi:MAG: gamma-glutamylcyclotransferase family protein [Pseudomonadota bacterium]|nr:gamma-glutamylcyclotransferase family protein [Pseudomonadota bacterium]